MNRSKVLVCAAVLVGATVLVVNQAVSQEGSGASQPPFAAKMQELMAEWMASLKPGPHHQKLENLVGSWETTTKMWWGGPNSPAVETTGTSEVKWVLGGRFLMEEHHGQMMMPDASGQMKPIPYDGIGLTGYNNTQNMYQSVWVSNADTGVLTMKGGMDPSGKLLRMYGEMDETMLDVYGRYVKYVMRFIDKDTRVFEIIDLHAGDDYKVIEITYKRKK